MVITFQNFLFSNEQGILPNGFKAVKICSNKTNFRVYLYMLPETGRSEKQYLP